MANETTRERLIEELGQFPETLAATVAGLTDEQLTAAPLEGEWSIVQNVHHCADSHMNAYVRCKLMATEENPPLKPYDEVAWAQFADSNTTELTHTLQLLGGLHARWVHFWQTLPEEAWVRTGQHMADGEVTLERQLVLYVGHCRAHLKQIGRNLTALETT